MPEAIHERPVLGGDAGAPDEDDVIRLERVSVRYRVPFEPVGTFKEYLIRVLKGRLGYRDVAALHDVTVAIKRGESVGIIGHNGAGKSTLLKLIARVLRPTEGRVWVKGRVVPLMELGAGFHGELTGRENTYLNGTLLGRSRQDIEEKFDEIVRFAELGDFIHAPLRTYSTGMAARLGFAIATAWEPDILIIDEALAAGDEAFQRKCNDRLAEFKRRGATLLLVSHDSGGVRKLCQRALWLDHGAVRALGSSEAVVEQYQEGLRRATDG